jgi:hypothetical protein
MLETQIPPQRETVKKLGWLNWQKNYLQNCNAMILNKKGIETIMDNLRIDYLLKPV